MRIASRFSPLLAAIVAALAASPRPARAQSNAAAAQTLFDEAKGLIAKGDWSHACPKLAESQRIDPTGGTILHLARCHMNEGKTATAWAEFHQALSVARRDGRSDREDAARAHIAALEPKLSKLVVVADDPSSELAIARDGEAVGRALWGTAVPVDPGAHEIVASAKGKKEWRARIAIAGDARSQTIHVPALEDDAHAAVVAPVVARPPANEAPAPTPEAPSRGSTQRTLGFVAGGAGLAGLAVGTAFGLISKSKHDDARSNCTGPSGKECNADGVALDGDAVSAGNVSTIAFVAGGALLATGAVLWLTAPRREETPTAGSIALVPSGGPGAGGLTMRGSW